MAVNYCVTLRGKQTGKVVVYRQGLYYHFSCRCALLDEGIYRLEVICGSKHESLGILAPKDDGFLLETKKPVKRVGEGQMQFILVPKHEKPTQIFVPISPEEPFSYITRLKQAFLTIRDGQTGIYTDEMRE